MLRIEKNKDTQRFCSLCGSEPAENQLCYSSNIRRSVIPICSECLSELQKKRQRRKNESNYNDVHF